MVANDLTELYAFIATQEDKNRQDTLRYERECDERLSRLNTVRDRLNQEQIRQEMAIASSSNETEQQNLDRQQYEERMEKRTSEVTQIKHELNKERYMIQETTAEID